MRIILVYLEPLDNEPMGLLYIGTILKNSGHSVKIVGRERKNSEKLFLREVRNFKPDLVGISITTPEADKAEEIAGCIKQNFPDITVIAGGPHSTLLPAETLRSKNIDACVIGEGERTVIELAAYYEQKNCALENIKGIAFLRDNALVVTEQREYIGNLDDLPFVDRGLLPEKVIFGRAGYPLMNPCMLITSVRGCPYNCRFCQPTVEAMFGRKLRRRSPENIIAEIQQLKQRYNIGGLWISDDTFSFDQTWTMRFCELMIGEKIDISWWANVRIDTARQDTLKKMQEAGCVAIFMTFECGSERIRKEILHKNFSNAQVISAYNIVRNLGLLSRTNIMLGSPTESEQDLQESLRLVKATQPHFITASFTTPLPGTYMYNEYQSKNMLDKKDWEYYDINHFKKIDCQVPDARLKRVFKEVQRGYSGLAPANRFRHLLEVAHFRRILYRRWKSMVFNQHHNFRHFVFDILALFIGSFSYFIHKNRYTRKSFSYGLLRQHYSAYTQ